MKSRDSRKRIERKRKEEGVGAERKILAGQLKKGLVSDGLQGCTCLTRCCKAA